MLASIQTTTSGATTSDSATAPGVVTLNKKIKRRYKSS